jgi:hypothetical protein
MWGHQVESLEAFAESSGITPKALLNRPEPHELGGLWFEAFNVLSSSRSFGMSGPLPIAISEMWAYQQMFGMVDEDERASFVRAMQRLDGAYLAAYAERADRSSGSVVADEPIPPENWGTRSPREKT